MQLINTKMEEKFHETTNCLNPRLWNLRPTGHMWPTIPTKNHVYLVVSFTTRYLELFVAPL